MSISGSVLNVSVAANTYIDDAKKRVAKLIELANNPANGVNPASIEKLDAVKELLQEADTNLADFAQMNGFSLS